jgi:hypothetical protein
MEARSGLLFRLELLDPGGAGPELRPGPDRRRVRLGPAGADLGQGVLPLSVDGVGRVDDES